MQSSWSSPAIGPESRLLAWAAGLIALAIGLTEVLLPFLFENASYDIARNALLPLGLTETALGISLLIWQVLPFERTRLPQISLILCSAAAAGWSVSVITIGDWTVACLNFPLAIALLLAAYGIESWLQRPVRGCLISATVGIGLALTGVGLLFLPGKLVAPTYLLIRPHAALWGAAMLLAAGALWAWIRSPGRGLSLALPVFAAGVTLVWMDAYGIRNGLPLPQIELGCLALIMLLAPFVPASWLSPPPRRLVNKLVAVATISVGIALLLVVLVLLRQTEAAYEQRAALDLSATAQQVGNNSIAFIDSQMRIAGALSRDPQVQSFDTAQQLTALQRGRELDPAASLISIADRNGITVLRSTGERPGVDRRQTLPGAAEIFDTHEPNWNLQVSPTLGVPAFAFRQPIFGPDGTFEGVIAIQVKLSTLASQLGATLSDPTARIIVADGQGRAVISPNPADLLTGPNLNGLPPIAAARAGKMGAVVYRDGRTRWLATPVLVKPFGWTVDVERPEEVVLAPANRAREQVTLLLAVAVLVSAGIAWAFAHGFIRPVTELVGLAHSFGEGKLEPDLPDAGGDEVGELVRAFGEMRGRLVARTAERELAEQAAAQSHQEVEALLSAADRLNRAVEVDDVLKGLVEAAVAALAVRQAAVVISTPDGIAGGFRWRDGLWQEGVLPPDADRSLLMRILRELRPYSELSGAGDSSAQRYIPAGDVLAVPVVGSDGRGLAVLWVQGRRDGRAFQEEDQRLALGIAHHAAVALDRAGLVRELRQSEDRFRNQALSDALTGLPNRTYFVERLTEQVDAAQREGRSIALLFLDLDGFKTINDSLGHGVGDEILRSVAGRLSQAEAGEGVVARFGGDEFAVLLERVAEPQEALRAAEGLLDELRRPMRVQSRDLVVTASFGVALGGISDAQAGPGDLLREADIALYQAKAAGKAQAVLFSQSMSAQAIERWALENDMRQAVAEGELRLFYQPIYDLRTRELVGTEALVRWLHPNRGLLEPDSFIHLAEETGLILPIGHWVLDGACAQAGIWLAERKNAAPLVMSVNLSAHQLQLPDLVQQVAAILSSHGLPPAALELELTESAVMREPSIALPKLEALKQLGIGIAIDDFGTGYSSLSYLQRLAVNALKIDRSFVNDLDRENGSLGIVQVVIDLAHARGLTVTAEGIETAAQLARLTALGCDRGQGFYLAPPTAGGALETKLAAMP